MGMAHAHTPASITSHPNQTLTHYFVAKEGGGFRETKKVRGKKVTNDVQEGVK